MLITEAADKFFVQLEADGRSRHTIRQYRRHIRKLAEWMADVGHSGDMSAITHEHIAEFLASHTAQTRPDGEKKKASSANCLRSSISLDFRSGGFA